MGVAAPRRPVPPPRERTVANGEWARERYCRIEAEKEVESWFTGQPYRWRSYEERNGDRWQDMDLVQPMDMFVLTK